MTIKKKLPKRAKTKRVKKPTASKMTCLDSEAAVQFTPTRTWEYLFARLQAGTLRGCKLEPATSVERWAAVKRRIDWLSREGFERYRNVCVMGGHGLLTELTNLTAEVAKLPQCYPGHIDTPVITLKP